MHLYLIRLWLLCGERTGETIFLYNSCGMLILVRVIPVKVGRSLTGIILTYIIIGVDEMPN